MKDTNKEFRERLNIFLNSLFMSLVIYSITSEVGQLKVFIEPITFSAEVAGGANHGGRIISDDIANYVDEVGEGLSKDGLGKLSGKSFNVTEDGINKVKDHIVSNGFDAYENTEMIKRLENSLKNGDAVSGADASYYMHELKESMLMQNGMCYEEAHRAALDFFEVSDFSVYHPDVIKMDLSQWNSLWLKFLEKK